MSSRSLRKESLAAAVALGVAATVASYILVIAVTLPPLPKTEDYYGELVMWFNRLLPVAAVVAASCMIAGIVLTRRIGSGLARLGIIVATFIVAVPAGFAVSLLVHNLTKPS